MAKGMDWKNVNWLYAAGSATLVYLVLIGGLLGPSRIWVFVRDPKLNEFGDFLAGIFAPLALIWLVAAVLTQRQELDEARKQFADSQAVIKAQLEGVQQQNEKAEQTAIRNYKLSLFEYRFEIFKELDAIARNIHAKRPWKALKEYADQISVLSHRSRFIFDNSIQTKLMEISAHLEAVANFDKLNTAGSMPNREPLSGISSALGRIDLMNKVEQGLSYTSRNAMFEKYLTVTERDIETKMRP